MKSFAIIPAAGRSQRMGRPKLLLPWGGQSIIEHVIGVWHASRVDRVIMVVHPLDKRLAEMGVAAGACVVRPAEAPAEMKDSVALALAEAALDQPAATDAWLLAPADLPGLKAASIDRLLDAYASAQGRVAADTIFAASWQARSGHPVLFPWSLAGEVARLAPSEGLNALVARHPVEAIETGPDALADDLDTPEDYKRLRARHGLS
jgi:molybdenum cofactor cytidylyltransferase